VTNLTKSKFDNFLCLNFIAKSQQNQSLSQQLKQNKNDGRMRLLAAVRGLKILFAQTTDKENPENVVRT
jgi:hypothetical protein